MSYRDLLIPQLRVDEGDKQFPYPDTVGKLTIGVGHNLTDDGLSQAARDFILAEDVDEAERCARTIFETFDSLTDARKAVLVNMAFNLEYRLRGFRDLVAAVQTQRWDDAANEIENSFFAKQVGARAKRLADAMSAG